MPDKQEILAVVVILVFFTLIAFGGWVGQSYFEARTYTRLTGRNVTTWDAMWVDLRVIEPATER